MIRFHSLSHNFTYLVLLFSGLFSLSAKAQNLHAVKDNIACLWGLKNDSGQWVLQAQFTRLDKDYGNFFVAERNEKWGILSMEGQTLVPFEYDKLQHDAYLNLPDIDPVYKIYAYKNGKAGVIDLEGKIRIPLLYDLVYREPYTDIFHIQIQKKLGIRNFEKELLPCKYTRLSKLEGGQLFVAGSNDSIFDPYTPYSGKNLGIINLKGDTIIPFRFTDFRIPKTMYTDHSSNYRLKYWNEPLGPLIVAQIKEGMALYTFEGKCMLEPRYSLTKLYRRYDADETWRYTNDNRSNDYNIYSNEALLCRENEKFGIVFPGKGLIQPPVYESILLQESPGKRPSLFCVSKEGKYGLLDESGKQLLACDYKTIVFYSGHIFVHDKQDLIKEFNWRKKEIEGPIYRKLLVLNNSQLVLSTDENFYAIINDSLILPLTVLAKLPGDIVVLNNYSAIQGKGIEAQVMGMNQIVGGGFAFWAISDQNNALLCNNRFKIIVNSSAYSYFENMNWSQNIMVNTRTRKKGIVDSTGRMLVDTLFEEIKECPILGRLFVKPYTPKNKEDGEYSNKGWAIADSTGKLLTSAIIQMQDFNSFNTCMFIRTESGVGVFDFEKGRFITPHNYRNGFFTHNGDLIMQSKNRLFVVYSYEGKKLSIRNWTGLIHLSADHNLDYYSNGFNKEDLPQTKVNAIPENEQATDPESVPLEEEWLLIGGDTLALLKQGKLEYNKRKILDRALYSFLEAHENDNSNWYDSYSASRRKTYSGDCPRLNSPGQSTYYISNPFISNNSGQLANKTINRDSIKLNDSLVMHMIRHIAPKARYVLQPKSESGDEDEREEKYYSPSNFYYRMIYMEKTLISLQVLDEYGYGGSSVNRDYFNRSVFENYQVTAKGWKKLSLAQLFKPGYEVALNAEIVRALQKADSLELDCNNPASYLKQCEGRFSFSKEGLWLYLQDNNGYEFIPQLIPWSGIRNLIPPGSAAYALARAR